MTRALLLYRYRRLPRARWAALDAGHAGAMFPWQSGSDGSDETPRMLFNPRSGRWMPDNSHRQRHVGIAVAYNVWLYYQATADLDFMYCYGAKLIIETARFFASLAEYDYARDRFQIRGAMGPQSKRPSRLVEPVPHRPITVGYRDQTVVLGPGGARVRHRTRVISAPAPRSTHLCVDGLGERRRIR